MLYCFTGDGFININNGYRYWSNICGDPFDPNGFYILIENLPEELRYAFEHIWSEDFGFGCYLIEFQGNYGIALEAEYDDCWAEDTKWFANHRIRRKEASTL